MPGLVSFGKRLGGEQRIRCIDESAGQFPVSRSGDLYVDDPRANTRVRVADTCSVDYKADESQRPRTAEIWGAIWIFLSVPAAQSSEESLTGATQWLRPAVKQPLCPNR